MAQAAGHARRAQDPGQRSGGLDPVLQGHHHGALPDQRVELGATSATWPAFTQTSTASKGAPPDSSTGRSAATGWTTWVPQGP